MRIVFLSFFVFEVLFGASYLISDLPLPKTYIFKTDTRQCDEDCLMNLLQEEKIFSFLAYIRNQNTSIQNPIINETSDIYSSILNLDVLFIPKELKIALLLPYKKIGKYATFVTNATFSYLITRNSPFVLKSYNVEDESKESLKTALENIKKDKLYYVIAPLSLEGAKNLIETNPKINIYIPTVNKQDLNTSLSNIYFGGIDYKEQSKKLLTQTKPPLVIFYTKSKRAKTITEFQKSIYLDENFTFQDPYENELFEVDSNDTIFENDTNISALDKKLKIYYISPNRTNLENILKDNPYIKYSTVMVNTPIVKTGMILSQLNLYEVTPYAVLSTQINYSPLIFSITQYQDRKNMLIANSITIDNNIFTQTNSLLSNDIVYDWINYSTTIGIDYFYSYITSTKRKYNIPVVDNQVIYPIEFVMPKLSKFQKVDIKLPQDTNQTSDLEDDESL